LTKTEDSAGRFSYHRVKLPPRRASTLATPFFHNVFPDSQDKTVKS